MTVDIKKHRFRAPVWRAVTVTVTAGLVIAWACGLDRTKPDPCDPYRLSVAQSVADNVLAPTFVGFEARANDLATATAAWSDAAEQGGDVQATRDAAATAWNEAMLVWQRAELMQVGPAGPSAFVVGGEDVRDEVYSWPTVSRCRVDEELVANEFGAEGFFDAALVNVQGLDALEYLLFYDGPDNACDASSTINADGSWDALGADELARRRAAFAAFAAAEVARYASDLAATWGPGGDYADWLVRAGDEDSPYEDPAAAVDDLVTAVLYLDVRVKDRKLAATTVDALESPLSGRSKEHVLANLEGLRLVLLGGEDAEAAYGFDDFLEALEQPDLAVQVLTALDDAIAAVEAVDGSFEDAVTADPGALSSAQSAVNVLDDLLKGPFVTTLKLRPPGEGAGDAD